MIEFELILPRRVSKNPEPKIFPGGDCGACVLSALTNISVSNIYNELKDGNVSPFGFSEMKSALLQLESDNKIYNTITEHPIWVENMYRIPFGLRAEMMSYAWFNYIRLAIEAGYYAVCEVEAHGKGVEKKETDHWVLICGVKTYLGELRGLGRPIINEIFISDSNRTMPDIRWCEVNEWLEKFGGFQALLAKPK